MPKLGLPEGNATIEELIDHVAKLQKQIEFMMEGNLGSKNIREIGDFLVGPKSFASRSGDVGISSMLAGQENVRFWAGSANINNAPYRVYDSGRLVATNAQISGNITLDAGSSINWGQVNAPTAAQVGALPNNTYIPTVPAYITATKITQTDIEAPRITGGHIRGGSIESDTTINVTTNLTVGNAINLTGSGDKWINHSSGNIKFGAVAGMAVYADQYIDLISSSVLANSKAIATQEWVQQNAVARFA